MVLINVAVFCCIAVWCYILEKNARYIMLEDATFNMLNYKQLDLLKQLKEQIKQDQMQRHNRYPGYVTQSANNPVANHRPSLPYNECSNTIGLNEAPTVVSYPYLSPYPQKPPAPYQQQAGHHLVQ